MKKSIITILSIICILITGCKTAPTSAGQSTNQSTADIDLLCNIAESGTFIGTSVYLNGAPGLVGHPNEKDKFILARNALSALIAAGTFSSDDLMKSLQGLPIKELQGTGGSVLIGEAVILWNQLGSKYLTLDKSQSFQQYVLPVAKALLRGLDRALGSPVSFNSMTPRDDGKGGTMLFSDMSGELLNRLTNYQQQIRNDPDIVDLRSLKEYMVFGVYPYGNH